MQTVSNSPVDTARSCLGNRFTVNILSLIGALALFASGPVLAQEVLTGHTCAGDVNNSLSCVSNDIQINNVRQMTPGEGGTGVTTCTEGDIVELDIALETLLNATERYDVVVWFGEQGNNPRAVAGGTCYASSLPDNPASTFILDAEAGADACLDVNSSPTPVTQFFEDVQVQCVDNVRPTADPNDDPDSVENIPDGELDLFALVSWGNSAGSLQCGTGPGEVLEPTTNPKCDAAILLGINVEVLAAASLTIVKNSSGGTAEFDFTTDVPGLGAGGAFTLDTTGDNTESISVNLSGPDVGGTYSVAETAEPGFQLVSATCDNGDDPSAITIEDEETITCTFNNAALGSVTIVKNTVGGDGSFDFTSDLPGGNFNIATAAGTGMHSEMNVPAGTYTVTETVPAGWDLTALSCNDGNSTVDLGTATATINLEDGESVTCTFTDTQDGRIEIEKQTLPDGSAQSFTFTGDVAGSLTDGQNAGADVAPGTYSSTETVPAGWVLTDITCDDGNSTGDTGTGVATFNVEAGETVRCVFTNTQDGSIEVVKNLSATGPAVETFGFTSNFNGTFDLIGDDATTGPIGVTPGSGYTVTEDDPTADGWANVSATCDDGSVPGTDIVVSPGEAVVCTFTNTPLGSATIVKNTVGGNDTFDFIGDAPFNGLQLVTVGGTASQDFTFQLAAGDYDATESPIPAGWSLTGLGCTEDGDQDSTVDLGTATATYDVELAETVTCTFTNTADGTLIIRKETVPDGAADSFTFTGDAAGSIRDFSTFAEELEVSGAPGIYSSAETVPAGWSLTNIACTGQVQSTVDIGVGTAAFEPGDTNVEVDLAAGETVICTFTNTAEGSITITKNSVGDTGNFNFNRDFGASFPLDTTGDNTESISFTGLLPDSYMVSETVPTNWTLTNIACSGATNSTITIGGAGGFDPGDTSVTIDLSSGEAITCTFTDNAHGTITVAKETLPDGSGQSFDFTGDITASLTDGQSSTPVFVQAGSYSAAETVPAGWDLTDISCSDGNSTGDLPSATASFEVDWGEDVTCTFTNTQDGRIEIEKQTLPDGSAQSFTFTGDVAGSLTDGQSAGADVAPGNYSSTETVPAGWDLTDITCDDGDSSGDTGTGIASFVVAPGETVRCVFTNTQDGRIEIEKQTLPDGSAQSFTFTGDVAGSLTDGQSAGADVAPGNYSSTETVPAGWELTDITCSDGDSTGDTGTGVASFVVAPGETVRCVFTNTQNASLTIVKQAPGEPSEFCFQFSAPTFGDGFCIQTDGFDGEFGFMGIADADQGLWSIAEIGPPAPWILTGASCDNGDDPSSVDVGPGDDITCTFVNSIPVEVPVNNAWALLLMILSLMAMGWYFRPAVRRS